MSVGVLKNMGIDEPEELDDVAEPNESFVGKPAPLEEVASSDPFDDFDDDFEEEWDDDLPGDADQFEPDEKEVDAPFSDDPEFDDE